MSSRLQQTSRASGAGDDSRTAATSATADRGTTIAGTGISFTAPGTIGDSGSGLAHLPVGSMVEVRGSTLNDRRWRVAASAAGSLSVTPARVRDEAAGAAVTIRKVD